MWIILLFVGFALTMLGCTAVREGTRAQSLLFGAGLGAMVIALAIPII